MGLFLSSPVDEVHKVFEEVFAADLSDFSLVSFGVLVGRRKNDNILTAWMCLVLLQKVNETFHHLFFLLTVEHLEGMLGPELHW